MKILAVSSGGGHWIELQRLMPAFSMHDVHFATVNETYNSDDNSARFTVIKDATRGTPLALVQLVFQLTVTIFKLKPEVVVTTGAAPGLFALVIGRMMGAKTIWIDSIANVDELSGSGRHAKQFADLWLTQWEHLAKPSGPEYAGKVL